MSIKWLRVETVDLAPEFAKEFHELTPLPGERALIPGRCQYLLDQICGGTFTCPAWYQGICRSEGGKKYRLDGQHSSYVLSHLPKGVVFPTGLKAVIQIYEFDSVLEDGFTLFNLFNHPKSVRNNIDAIGIFRAQHTDLTAVSREAMSKLLAGVNLYVAKHGGASTPARHRGVLADAEVHREFILWGVQFEGTKNQGWLSKPGIVEEMYEDFLTNREAAEEAWYLTFTESHPEPDHDTRIAAEDFKKMSQRPRGIKTSTYKARAHKMWTKFIKTYSPKSAEGEGIEGSPSDDEPGGFEMNQLGK
jgi:hypothetical protein